MTHHVDDGIQLVRAEGIVLLRERQFSSSGKIGGCKSERSHHAIHTCPLARSGTAQVEAFTSQLRRVAKVEFPPRDDRESLRLSGE